MSLLVRLHVFSGMPDPLVLLDEAAAKDVLGLAEESKLTRSAPHRGLGYRGFSLLPTTPDKRTDALIDRNEQSNAQHGLFVSGDPKLELRIFELTRKRLELGEAVERHVREAIETRPQPELNAKSVGCPPCVGASAPAYNPGWWNNNPVTLQNNNCYNYANDQATNTFAQPGRATGTPMTGMSCAGVQPSAVSDGLVAAPNFAAPTPGWYVALVIWPGTDFHWYRQDSNGCWSHKPGSTPVRNTDSSGNIIADPATCDRGPYTAFCSYMITNRGVRIR